MGRVTSRGADLYYETAGGGDTVVFVEDAGFGAWTWGWQHRALAGPFETLAWDLPGTGRSAPAGEYTVAAMAADLEAVLADHGARDAHLVGCGLGGAIAVEYAVEYARAETVTLFGTTPGGPRATLPADPREAAFAPLDDPDALRESLSTVLSAAFRREHPDVVECIVEWRRTDDADPGTARAQARAMDDYDASDRLYELTDPALVVHGTGDRVVPPENGRLLADGLPRGRLETFDGAGHLVFVERSRPVNDLLVEFLAEHASEDPFE